MVVYLLLLRWLRHDSDKKNFFLELHSLRHDYDKKSNYFSFKHHFHYTINHKDNICFAIATTFTTPWSRQKFILFLFQHYFHYTIVMRIKLLHNYHEKKTAVFFPLGSSLVLKDPYIIQQFNRQEFQWSHRYFFPEEVQCF